jgi:hypothetical protein
MADNTFWVDKLVYGNPSRDDVQNMEVKNFLTAALYEDLCGYPCPGNSSVAVKHELSELLKYAKSSDADDRKRMLDVGLVPAIVQNCAENGIDPAVVGPIAQSVVRDVLPLVTRLKYRYNRPRPFQLAYYYNVKLFPDFSKFVSSPSYPSGHACLGGVICEVLGSRIQGAYAAMKGFAGDIAETRLYMGVHYLSDNNFALQVAQRICELPQFREKYEFDVYLK